MSSVGAAALALVTVPAYLHLIGTARYGVVAFVWLIVGYFGLFVLGLDRAIANSLARHRHDPDASHSLFHTGMMLSLLTSGIGAVVMYFVGYQILAHILGNAAVLRPEILGAMPWIAASVPLATTTSLLIGALEAYECFPLLAATQFCSTALFQIAPILVAWLISPQLTWVIPAAILSRTAASLFMFGQVWRVMRLRMPMRFQRRWIRPLLSYGSAISISGIVSPILVGLDRLLIGAVLGAGAVAYYVVPANLLNVVQILPGSLLRVLFPRLSTLTAVAASGAAQEAALGLAVVLAPLIACAILAAHTFMTLWLGASFAAQARGVLEILLYGAWLNCLAWVPVTLLHAQGRPGVVARLHVIELAPFVGILWAGVHFAGLLGAAASCAFRVWVDALLLFRASGLARALAARLLWPTALITAALATSLALPQATPGYVLAAAALGAVSIGWSLSQVPHDQRRRVLNLVRVR